MQTIMRPILVYNTARVVSWAGQLTMAIAEKDPCTPWRQKKKKLKRVEI
jgi:hypothetical protein